MLAILRDGIPILVQDTAEKNFVRRIEVCDPLADWTEVPEALKELIRSASDAHLSGQPDRDLPITIPQLQAVLLPHQSHVIRHSLAAQKTLLALGMGCGKTICSIATMIESKLPQHLIICPASLKDNWRAEINRFAPHVTVQTITARSTEVERSAMCIISIDLVKNVLPLLRTIPWDYVVVDEAHYVKTAASQRSKALKTLLRPVKHVLLLTGTPAHKNSELWHLLHIMYPTKFPLFHHHQVHRSQQASTKRFYFAERYCEPELVYIHQGRQAYKFNANRRSDELHLLTSPFILRMRTEDVLTLPPLTRESVMISQATPQDRENLALVLSEVEEIRSSRGSLAADARLLEQTRETMRQKKDITLQYIVDKLASYAGKIIVFFHHHEMGDFLREALVCRNIGLITISGKTNISLRTKLLQTFERDVNCRVGLLGLGATSTGLNLTFVQLVLYTEMTFNSILHTQADARTWRHGQLLPVTIQYLMMGGSTDDMLWRSLENKLNCQSRVIDNQELRPDHRPRKMAKTDGFIEA